MPAMTASSRCGSPPRIVYRLQGARHLESQLCKIPVIKDLHNELESKRRGKHWETRVRNLRWAIAIVDKQMAVPYQWRSMPEVMAEIPGLQGVPRGGLQQVLTNLID